MNKKIESMTISTKNFWNRNKGKIAVATTATTVGLVYIIKANQRTVQGFIDENGLQDQFDAYVGYIPDEEV